jgi:hypothetical protein
MTRTHLPPKKLKKIKKKRLKVGDGFVLLGNFFPRVNWPAKIFDYACFYDLICFLKILNLYKFLIYIFL